MSLHRDCVFVISVFIKNFKPNFIDGAGYSSGFIDNPSIEGWTASVSTNQLLWLVSYRQFSTKSLMLDLFLSCVLQC